MKTLIRGAALAAVGTLLSAEVAWAHPGHHAMSELGAWVGHLLASPYHSGGLLVVALLLGLGLGVRSRGRRITD